MRGKPLLLIAGACVVGTVAVWMVRDLGAEPASLAPDTAPTSRVDDIAAAPRTEIPLATKAAVEARPPAAPDTKPVSPADRDRELIAKIDANLSEKLRGERVDANWARDTEAAIANAVARPGLAGLRLDAVTCGSTLCRVAITAGEQVDDVSGLVEELTSTQPFRAGGFLRFTGARAVTMFVARAGTKLPAPPRS